MIDQKKNELIKSKLESSFLNSFFEKRSPYYGVLHDFTLKYMLPFHMFVKAQFDHILIGPKAIYVIDSSILCFEGADELAAGENISEMKRLYSEAVRKNIDRMNLIRIMLRNSVPGIYIPNVKSLIFVPREFREKLLKDPVFDKHYTGDMIGFDSDTFEVSKYQYIVERFSILESIRAACFGFTTQDQVKLIVKLIQSNETDEVSPEIKGPAMVSEPVKSIEITLEEINAVELKPQLVKAMLKQLRKDESDRWGIPDNRIFSDKDVDAIVKAMPKTLDELQSVPGIGKVKFGRYGEKIFKVLTELRTSAVKESREIG